MKNDRIKIDEIKRLKQEKQDLLERFADLQYRYHQVEQNVFINWLRKRLNF